MVLITAKAIPDFRSKAPYSHFYFASSSSLGRLFRRLIASCNRCSPVGRTFIEHEVYTWLPEDVKTLAVAESLPPGHKESFLYNLSSHDRMRLSLGFILQVDPDVRILHELKRNSIFVTDAIKCRPSSAKNVKEMAEGCRYLLKHELDLLRPGKILALGRVASLSISSILGIEVPGSLKNFTEIKSEETSVIFAPHSNYIFRFRRDLSNELRGLFFA